MLGVVVTVFVVDRLIQKREERRSIPQKLAVYEDVRSYTSQYLFFWTSTYRESVPENDPETIEVFFSEMGMTKIFKYLYMDSEPNVSPRRKWWDWIIHNANEFKVNGDKILDRHSSHIDPVAFGFVHQLTESFFNKVLLMSSSIRQSDMSNNFPRVKVLGSYSMLPINEDYQAILGLIKWCNKTHKELLKYNTKLNTLSEYIPQKNKKMPPKCMIPLEILEQQINELKTFRQEKK